MYKVEAFTSISGTEYATYAQIQPNWLGFPEFAVTTSCPINQEPAGFRPRKDADGYAGTAEFEAEIDAWDAANPDKPATDLRYWHNAAKRAKQTVADAASRGRSCYVRFGELPKEGRSWNSRDNMYEAGVSVYPAFAVDGKYYIDLREVDAASALFIVGAAPAFEVSGTVVGHGADGEPLLTNCTAKRIRKNTCIDKLI